MRRRRAWCRSATALHERGAQIFSATAARGIPVRACRSRPTGHALTDPIAIGLSFYRFVEAVAVARGYNPDQPRHLKKVTETV